MSHQTSTEVPSRIDVTFVNQNERDVADTGLVESRGISLVSSNTTSSNSSAYLNVEIDRSKDLNLAQRVTYDNEQKGLHHCKIHNDDDVLTKLKQRVALSTLSTVSSSLRQPILHGILGWHAMDRRVIHSSGGPPLSRKTTLRLWHMGFVFDICIAHRHLIQFSSLNLSSCKSLLRRLSSQTACNRLNYSKYPTLTTSLCWIQNSGVEGRINNTA